MSAKAGGQAAVPSLEEALRPGAHGGNGARVAAALGVDPDSVLDLSATVNPLAPDVVPLVAARATAARRYPDATDATSALADAIGIDASRLLLTNGGAEAIALVATELGRAAVLEPEFSLWRRHLVTNDPQAGRARSNPNNPTGRLAGVEERAAAWDEAFYPLATGSWTRGDHDDGAFVVGSLTKLFACPGLRLGYVVGPDEAAVERLARRQPTWSVNALALAVLPALLEAADLERWAAGLRSLRSELVSLLTGVGLVAQSADAPWVLVPDADHLRLALGARGVVVRDCTSFGMPGTQRIAVPGPHGLEQLASALVQAMEERG